MKPDLLISNDQLKWSEREFVDNIDTVRNIRFFDDGKGSLVIRVEAKMHLRGIKELINGRPNILINPNPSSLFCRWAKQMAGPEENKTIDLLEDSRFPKTRQIKLPDCQPKPLPAGR